MWKSYKIIPFINITEMYSLFYRHYESGYRFEGEMHNFWECVYVVDGSVYVTADGRVHSLTKGDFIVHKPLEMHKFFTDNNQGVSLFVLSFSADGDFVHELSDKVFCLNKQQKCIIEKLIQYVDDTTKKYTVSQTVPLYQTALELFNIDILFSQTVSTYISELVLSLAQNGNICTASHSENAELYKKAIDCMNSNINKSLSVDELAYILNVSVSSLKRLFSKYSGISVHKYFTTLKIKTATDLLSSGMSVREVLEKLGFSSQAYFSACYTRETGLMPTQVKKLVNKI